MPLGYDNPAQAAYQGNRQLQRRFLSGLKKFFVEPIPWLVEKGRELSDSITEPTRDVGTADRVMAQSLLGEPGFVPPIEMSDQEVRDTSSMMKGAVGGAIEGLSEVPSPADVATVGLSAAAKGALRAPRLVESGSKVAKLANLIDESSNVVNMGLGAMDVGEGIRDRDPAKIGAGAFQSALGGIAHAAGSRGHDLDLPDPGTPDGPRPELAEVANPDLMLFSRGGPPPSDPRYARQLIDRFRGTEAHQDFTSMIEDIRDKLAVHFSNIPSEQLGTTGLNIEPPPWRPDMPSMSGEAVFGTPAERMANTTIGTMVDLGPRSKGNIPGHQGTFQYSGLRGMYDPEHFVPFGDGPDGATINGPAYYEDIFNKASQDPNAYKKGAVRTSPISIVQQMAGDMLDMPQFAETLKTPQDIGREFVRRTYTNILHEMTHAVDMTATHTPKIPGQTWDPVNEKYMGPDTDIHRNKQFTSLQSLVREYMAGALDQELMGQYGAKLGEHLPTIEQFGARIHPPEGVARIPSPFMEGAGGPRGLAGAADRGGGFGGSGGPIPSESAARQSAYFRASGLPDTLLTAHDTMLQKGFSPAQATAKLRKVYEIMINQGMPEQMAVKAASELANQMPARAQGPPAAGSVGAPPPPVPPPSWVPPAIPTGQPPGGMKPPRVNVPKTPPKKAPGHDYKTWVNARQAVQVEGANARKKFEDLSAPNIQQILDFNADPTANPRFKDVQDHLDNLYKMQRAAGTDIGFKENYLPQMWKETPQQIYAAYRRLGLKPSHTMKAVFSNYAEGIAAGLTPRYDNIADLVGLAESKARKAVADRMFYNYLKQNHLVKPANSAPPDWVTINPDAFPLHRFKQGQLRVVTNVKAPPEIAFKVNEYLDAQGNSFLKQVADKFTDVKNVVMSSGIPLTSMNAHGFNMLSRIYAIQSNPVSGAVEVMKSIPKFIAPQIFKADMDKALADAPRFMKAGMTLKVEEHPFKVELPPLRERLKDASDFMRPGSGKDFRPFHGLREIHKALFEDPLFQKFIPMVKVQYAKKMEDQLLRDGVLPEEATSIAAHWMNEAFGGINYAEMLGQPVKGLQWLRNKETNNPVRRSNSFQNFLRVAFNAPDWAESNIKLASGALKGFKNPKDPKFQMYRNVIQNVMAFYMMSSLVQKLTSGHYMHENPEGRKASIAAGETAEGRARFLHPSGTGWDFAKLPYEVIDKIAHGDMSGLSKVLAARLHPMAQATLALVTNRNYRGQQILGGNQPASRQVGNVVESVASVTAPSYVREPIESLRSDKKGFEEGLVESLELPIRYSKDHLPPDPGPAGGASTRKGPRRTRPLSRRRR